MDQAIVNQRLSSLEALQAQRQALAQQEYLQGLVLTVEQKPPSSPCAPPLYVGRLQRADQQPFEDGKTVHWVSAKDVKDYQERLRIGAEIARLDDQIQALS